MDFSEKPAPAGDSIKPGAQAPGIDRSLRISLGLVQFSYPDAPALRI